MGISPISAGLQQRHNEQHHVSVIAFLGLVIVLTSQAPAANLDRASLQKPSANWDSKANKLSDLLWFDDGRPIRTVADWKKKRERLRRHWTAFLGKRPKKAPELDVQVLERTRQPDHERRLIRYFVEDTVQVRAYLLLPDEPHPKRPGVVVLHPTTDATIRQPVGLDDTNKRGAERIGLHLAQRGYAVICPENYLWTEGKRRLKEAPAELFQRHPGWNGMDKMTWDGSRAVDVLIAGKHCDPNRIGCIGHSLGAKEALYLAAFDERIAAAVSSEGGIGLTFSNWHDLWYLGPGIQAPGFQPENHEVLALIAPRPFLLLAGQSADGDKSWAFLERARPVYALFGSADRLGWYNHRKGHAIPPDARKLAFAWLDKWLIR